MKCDTTGTMEREHPLQARRRKTERERKRERETRDCHSLSLSLFYWQNYGFIDKVHVATVDIPGDDFWRAAVVAGAAEEMSEVLSSAGMQVEETVLRLGEDKDGLGEGALDWCQLCMTSREELLAAGWQPGGEECGANNDVETLSNLMVQGTNERESRALGLLIELCRGYLEKGKDKVETVPPLPASGPEAALVLLAAERRALEAARRALEERRSSGGSKAEGWAAR